MSHVLPHLPQNTSARSLSPTSPVFRPYSPSLSCLVSAHSGLECETLRDPRRSGGYTKSASPTGYEPKLTQSGDFGPRQEYRDRSVPNTRKNSGRWLAKSFHRRYGGDWKFWCRHALRPIKETLRLRFSRKHCRNQKQNKTQVQIVLKPTTLKERERRERESLKSNSSQDPRASGNPDAVFSSRSDEPGNQVESSMFKYADPSELWRSLLDGSEDHLLSQARSELMRQEHQVGSLNSCINELQFSNRLILKDWNCKTLIQGFFESRREQVRLQEELSLKEKVLRDNQTRSIHEMEEVKRAQELRVDDSSVQKLRESYETIQRLTSQMQEMQEQMNSMNDSREFQEVESNHSGRLSHVPSQPPSIPSSRSFLSRDKRLPPDTWNTSGPLENVFGNKFSTFDSSPKASSRNSNVRHQERQKQFHEQWEQGPLSQERIKGTIPMSMFARRPSTISSLFPVDLPQNPTVGQQKLQISELSFDKFPTPSTFLCWKIRFKNQVTTCYDFPSEAMSRIK